MAYLCLNVYMYVWRPEVSLGYCNCGDRDMVFHWDLDTSVRQGWLVIKPSISACFHLLSTGIINTCHQTCLFRWVLRTEERPLESAWQALHWALSQLRDHTAFKSPIHCGITGQWGRTCSLWFQKGIIHLNERNVCTRSNPGQLEKLNGIIYGSVAASEDPDAFLFYEVHKQLALFIVSNLKYRMSHMRVKKPHAVWAVEVEYSPSSLKSVMSTQLWNHSFSLTSCVITQWIHWLSSISR